MYQKMEVFTTGNDWGSLGEEEMTQTRTVGGDVFGIILEAPLPT